MSMLRDVFSGTIWVIAARWSIRGIGLISTLVLARLLSPADFGVVAMAMFVVGLIEVFGDTGLVLYIIRHSNPQRRHFDTVWTLRLLVGVCLAGVMVLLAPAGATFFNEPRVTGAMQVLALRPLLLGLENPGIIHFRRDMVFSKDFQFLVLNKAVSFVVTVVLAFVLRNYWALVLGIVSGGVASTLQSYRMHPYRPRFAVSETRAVWGFSFWILMQNLFVFLNARIDELIIGRIKSTTMMGYYTLASDVASSPVQEIVAPLARVLFPGIVRWTRDDPTFTAAFSKVLSGVAVVVFSISTGIALVAADVTLLLLGPKWASVVPLLRVLAISAGFLALVQPLYTLLNATGRPRSSATLSFIRQVMLVAAMVPAAIWYDLTAVALARAAVAFVTFVLTALVYARLLNVSVLTIWASLFRPALSAIAMTGVVVLVQHVSPDLPAVRLGLSVLSGAVSYLGTLFMLWRLAGRPDSIEADLLSAASSVIPTAAQVRRWSAKHTMN